MSVAGKIERCSSKADFVDAVGQDDGGNILANAKDAILVLKGVGSQHTLPLIAPGYKKQLRGEGVGEIHGAPKEDLPAGGLESDSSTHSETPPFKTFICRGWLRDTGQQGGKGWF